MDCKARREKMSLSFILEEQRKMKTPCKKCGHLKSFYAFEKVTSKVCEYCGSKVYKNDFEEFKDKLLKAKKVKFNNF